MQEIIVTTLKKFYKSMLIGRADTSKMLAPARDTESLMTLWNDFNFALTEPQKDYLNEQIDFFDYANIRGRAGAVHSGHPIRRLVRLDHAGGAGVLHHLHGAGDRVAHPVSP